MSLQCGEVEAGSHWLTCWRVSPVCRCTGDYHAGRSRIKNLFDKATLVEWGRVLLQAE